MKHFTTHISISLLAVLLLAGCHKKKTEDDANAPMPVSVLAVGEDSILIRQTYPGVLTAKSQADVVARVNGTILNQLFKPGDYVRSGQPLFTIESTIYRDAVKEAQAQLSDANSAYGYASRQYDAMKRALASDAVAEMEVIKAKSTMEQAQAQAQAMQQKMAEAMGGDEIQELQKKMTEAMTRGDMAEYMRLAGELQQKMMSGFFNN